MKYSLKFLKKFIDIPVDFQKLFEDLTNLGFNLENYEKIEEDISFDLEITSNRPDVLSHYGLAREISAFYGIELKKENYKNLKVTKEKIPPFEIEIQYKKLCPRYSALFLDDVKIEPSPPWLKNQLESVGIRSINNIVDISNYILVSIGHPNHPFDFDKIKNGKIIVREAIKGEKIKTLDGVERKLEGGELLIADSEKPIGLAGIMGGEETEVTSSTKRILIESAYFLPSSIRNTSRKLGLQTEASQRFGRGADFENTIFALMVMAYYIEKLNCGKVSNIIYDFFPEPLEKPQIKFSFENLNKFFGYNFKKNWVENLIRDLNIKIEKGDNLWILKPPSWRQDLKEEVDIFEEVGRFYGYNNLPSKLPSFELGKGWEIEETLLEKKAQDTLFSLGLTETISYIFSKEEEIKRTETFSKREPVLLSNPLNLGEKFLRVSLIPGLLRTYKNNLSKNIYDVEIFEVGKVYFLEEEKYKEETFAGVLISSGKDFYQFKGIMESFLSKMGSEEFEFDFKNLGGFYENGSGIIKVKNGIIGNFGQLITESPFPVFVFEVCLKNFLENLKKIKAFKPISQFPPIDIDMNIGHPINFYYRDIIKAIEEKELPNLISINFKDRFIKKEKIYTTITLRFQSFERSLTMEEINKIREDLAEHLLKNYPITF